MTAEIDLFLGFASRFLLSGFSHGLSLGLSLVVSLWVYPWWRVSEFLSRLLLDVYVVYCYNYRGIGVGPKIRVCAKTKFLRARWRWCFLGFASDHL